MKRSFLTLISILFCSNVFAFTVTDQNALSLFKALENSHAKVNVTSDNSIISVSSVECRYQTAFASPSHYCKFIDNSTKNLVKVIDDEMQPLMSALQSTELKKTIESGEDYYYLTVSAKTIECTSPTFGFLNCEIIK